MERGTRFVGERGVVVDGGEGERSQAEPVSGS